MNATASIEQVPHKVWTEADLEALPEDGYLHEVVNGELIMSTYCYSLTRRKLIGPGGFLEGEQLLAGFRYPIAELFKDWDWE